MSKDINELFFGMIRVSIGVSGCLSKTPTSEEWKMLYDMAEKQSLLGVFFVALQRLGANSDDGFTRIGISETLYLTWLGMAAKIQQRNEVMNQQCIDLQRKLLAYGIRSSILKGQAVGRYYGQLAALRQSGDIDIFVDCGREKAVEYARTIQSDVDWDYKHLHLNIFPETEVEMHYVPEVFLNLRKNRKLQLWFKEHIEQMFSQYEQLVAPSLDMNLFYILLHIYRHFLYEGVGVRQFMDFYWTLSNSSLKGVELKCSDASRAINLFGMTRFSKGTMWIMKEIFGLDDAHLLCEPDEKEGKYILKQVMIGGNFGKYDERLTNVPRRGKLSQIKRILRHNLHLLTHYPVDTLWAPLWIVYHWCWKHFVNDKI